ncbi:MAG TPA: VWA domain-containing protein [Thermoanaerobaculia bacterium]
MRAAAPVAFLLLVLFALPAAAQQQPYIETFELRLHNFDVVVTDAKGQPVRGLTQADFVVIEDGAEKPITNFSAYDLTSGTTTATSSAKSTTVAVATAAPAPPPRRFVFFIDDLDVQRMTRDRLIRNAAQLLGAMREGDTATVIRPTAEQKIVQEFTSDRAALERALREAINASSDNSGQKAEIRQLQWRIKTAGNALMRDLARRDYVFAARRRVEHRLGQLRALTSSLGEYEGRKVVVLVSMGLSTKPGNEAYEFLPEIMRGEHSGLAPQVVDEDRGTVDFDALADTSSDPQSERATSTAGDYTTRIADIARAAAANGVTIYALEPDVTNLIGTGRRGGAEHATKRGGDGVDPNQVLPHDFQTDLLTNSAMTLTSLTEKTGGRWFRGIGSIDDIFQQVTQDAGTYYSLAIRATGEETKPRRVEVQVRNRPELRVRTRTEVIEKTTSREMEDLVVASLIYPRKVNELAIDVAAGTPEPERGYARIPLDITIPTEKLTFLENGDGNFVATFDVHFAAAGQERDFISGGKQQQRIVLTPEQYGRAEGAVYHYKTGILVSPGRARIAIGVLDTTTSLTGFKSVDVVAK